MRKSFDGLAGIVRSHLQDDPFNGEVFIFMNKKRNLIKLLHWESGGFTLYYKRLEKGRFELPENPNSHYHLCWPDLVMIIEGIQLKDHQKKVRFSFK